MVSVLQKGRMMKWIVRAAVAFCLIAMSGLASAADIEIDLDALVEEAEEASPSPGALGGAIQQLLSTDAPEQTAGRAAFRGLGKDAVPDLLQALRHERPFVRLCAIHALERIKDPSARPALQAVIEKDKNDSIRARAAQAMAVFQDKVAMKVLVRLLESERAEMRYAAAEGIVSFRVRAAVYVWIHALLRSPDPGIRHLGAQALERAIPKPFGEDYAKWAKWWEAEGDRFRFLEATHPYPTKWQRKPSPFPAPAETSTTEKPAWAVEPGPPKRLPPRRRPPTRPAVPANLGELLEDF